MTPVQAASEQITDEVTAWPGVRAGFGRRGEWAFTVGRKEIGHLHGDRVAHFGFPKDVWQDLFDADRSTTTRCSPGSRALGHGRSRMRTTSGT